ncbi:unnamed protein product [Durusdinium trenchii]|uniref:Uncharacterized protein n=2 Tax=Durusdinium trenchii TaxID=1381693 RepID=A0ABP0LJT4_9DINO
MIGLDDMDHMVFDALVAEQAARTSQKEVAEVDANNLLNAQHEFSIQIGNADDLLQSMVELKAAMEVNEALLKHAEHQQVESTEQQNEDENKLLEDALMPTAGQADARDGAPLDTLVSDALPSLPAPSALVSSEAHSTELQVDHQLDQQCLGDPTSPETAAGPEQASAEGPATPRAPRQRSTRLRAPPRRKRRSTPRSAPRRKMLRSRCPSRPRRKKRSKNRSWRSPGLILCHKHMLIHLRRWLPTSTGKSRNREKRNKSWFPKLLVLQRFRPRQRKLVKLSWCLMESPISSSQMAKRQTCRHLHRPRTRLRRRRLWSLVRRRSRRWKGSKGISLSRQSSQISGTSQISRTRRTRRTRRRRRCCQRPPGMKPLHERRRLFKMSQVQSTRCEQTTSTSWSLTLHCPQHRRKRPRRSLIEMRSSRSSRSGQSSRSSQSKLC